ncbi:hypothetical protein E0Z10_g1627 [Xylaria hypoxylon]|uniref:Protein kinase domain-containing protein n=1 Tax=Xylaria hypoxylon TaxID=37992 RepID=A0A4Z0YT39_9PEZI|nr:hypothetical protein E0Z10_g1627 [Xylaria hypoxylon]
MAQPAQNLGGVRDDIIQNVVRETRACFNSKQPAFRFDKLLGSGAAGVLCRVVETATPPGRGGRRSDRAGLSRRLAVKRAIGAEAEEDLRSEVVVLKRLRGAEHIVRLIAFHDDRPQAPTFLNDSKRVLSSLWRATTGTPFLGQRSNSSAVYDSLLDGLRGPAVVMEYLENGSLGALLEKLRATDILLPNRVLWSFCLCVVRACIAHAYPPEGDEDAPNQLERIRRDRPPQMLGHGDIHENNSTSRAIFIIRAPREPPHGTNFAEHNLVPALKLIDFGRAQESERDFKRMVYDLWLEMLALITRKRSARLPKGMYYGVETHAVEIQHADAMGCPKGNGAAYPTLDDALRHFLACCTIVDRNRRPSLERMLAEARRGAAQPAEAYTPNEEYESDAAIDRLLGRLLLDADMED